MPTHFEKSKRGYLSNKDNNSFILFKCDSCHLNKPHLISFSNKIKKKRDTFVSFV
jgi:hypothetical protein